MLSSHIQEFLGQLKRHDKQHAASADADRSIRVNPFTNRVGELYERVRYLVDYKEEHVIRVSAIERISRRKLIFEQKTEVGLSLVQELVAAGYLPNNSMSEEAAEDAQRVIDKFLALRQAIHDADIDGKDVTRRLIRLAASDIEALWYPAVVDELVAEAFYKTVRPLITCDLDIAPEELDAQIYIACRRALLSNSDDAIMYAFWHSYFPEWKEMQQNAGAMQQMAERYRAFERAITHQVKHPLGAALSLRLKNHALYFSLVREIAEQHGMEAEQIFISTGLLEREVKSILEKKYRQQKERVRRSGIRAMVYIFFTKTLLAIGIEAPYDLWVYGSLAYTPLAVNILFHPLLLFLITRGIAPLGQQNTERIIAGVHSILAGESQKPIYIRLKKTRGSLYVVFALCYAALFAISFGVIVWVLRIIDFHWIGIGLFLFFLALVSYVGLRIRHNAQTWRVDTADEGGLGLLWGIATLPIIQTGRWLSATFSSVNVLVFVMDFIIEAPFKVLLSGFDLFVSFLKKKKEETY